jgi:hypothetical protein
MKNGGTIKDLWTIIPTIRIFSFFSTEVEVLIHEFDVVWGMEKHHFFIGSIKTTLNEKKINIT